MEGADAFVSDDAVDIAKAIPALLALSNSTRDEGGGLDDDFHGNNSDDSRPNSNQSSCVITKEQMDGAFANSQDTGAVKALVRLHHLPVLKPERKTLWKAILDKRMDEKRGFPDASVNHKEMYDDTLVSCFGAKDLPSEEPPLPGFVDQSHTTATFYLTPSGRVSVSRILNCLEYNCPQVAFCPQLYPITSLARHFLSEADTYRLVSNLVTSKQITYLIQSRLQAEVTWRVTMELCQKLCRKYMAYLQAESSKEEVEGLLQQCIWWVFEWLPFPHVARILDTFLVEGDKVLYRVCCALVSIFTKKLQGKPTQNSGDGSNPSGGGGGGDPSKWSGAIKKRGLQGAFIHFCREIPVSPAALLEKGFRYRNFSKSTINQLKMKIELEVKSNNLIGPASTNQALLKHRHSADNFNLEADGPPGVKAISDNLTYKELTAIWRWIPQRATMGTPQLVYASYNDGFSLSTFYAKSEPYEPTVLIVKTTQQEVFGAYCSTSWAQRGLKDERGCRQIYFGGGETFLFTFSRTTDDFKEDSREGVVVYPWVLGPSSNSHIDQSNLTKAELHSHQLFMAGQHDMISIGGGGGNGIYLDGTLSRGKTESCKTFGNPPLCTSKDFDIAAIEVFGLAFAD